MEIALIGYGKMGKAIEEIALQRGHQIALKVSRNNKMAFIESNLQTQNPPHLHQHIFVLHHFGYRSIHIRDENEMMTQKLVHQNFGNEKSFWYQVLFSQISLSLYLFINSETNK